MFYFFTAQKHILNILKGENCLGFGYSRRFNLGQKKKTKSVNNKKIGKGSFEKLLLPSQFKQTSAQHRHNPISHCHRNPKTCPPENVSIMVLFRKFLKAILADQTQTQTQTQARTFLTSISAFPWYAPHHSNRLCRSPTNNRFLSPGPGPGPGPLFLSRPPWKLSQSATPLYLRENAVVFPRVHPFNLLRSTPPLPLRFPDPLPSVSTNPSLFHSFVNLPNFISFSRLLSGPLLAWYLHFSPFFFFLKTLFGGLLCLFVFCTG